MKKSRHIITLTVLFLIYSGTLFSNNIGKINSTQVRLRSNPSVNSKILALLDKNEVITIISKQSNEILLGVYFGRWYLIETSTKKQGYVLNAFIDENDGDEKFHIFFKKFYASLKNKEWFAIQRIGFPFKAIYSNLSGVQNPPVKRTFFIINKKEDLHHLSSGDGREMSPVFSFIQQKYIKAYIDFFGTGCSKEWFFIRKNGKWYLHQAIIHSY